MSRRKISRILCISPHFPPHANAEAFSGGKMVAALLGQGIEVNVLAFDYVGVEGEAEDSSSFWKPLIPIACFLQPTPEKCFTTLCSAVRFQTLSWTRWVSRAVAEAQRLNAEKPYDIVYSRSLPSAAHIAGYWISRAINLPWVANLNDVWDWHYAPEPYYKRGTFFHETLSKVWFRRMNREATLITYPSQRLCNYHQALAGYRTRTAIIPHIGYRVNNDAPATENFLIVHAGILGFNDKNERPAGALLMAFRSFLQNTPEARDSAHLVFIGPEDRQAREMVQDLEMTNNIVFTGRLSYEHSLGIIAQASLCVLVEAPLDEGIFLTTKFVDYLTTEKPVLALSPRVGVVADLLPARCIHRCDVNDSSCIEFVLRNYFQHWQNGTLPSRKPEEELSRTFSPDIVAANFLDAVENALSKGTGSTVIRRAHPIIT